MQFCNRRVGLLVAVAGLACVQEAWAQNRAPRRTATRGVFTAPPAVAPTPAPSTPTSSSPFDISYQGGLFALRDRERNRTIFSSLAWDQIVRDTAMQTTVTFTPAAGGDGGGGVFSVTYTNQTATPQTMGKITVPGLRFPADIEMYFLRQDASKYPSTNFGYRGNIYPNGWYSPAYVLTDGQYTVGISLLYPAVEYNHPVDIVLLSPEQRTGDGGKHYQVQFRLVHDYFHPTMAPGETRTYRVAVRVQRSTEPWIKTLVPYREYFQSLYGPVDYVRDPRPVYGQVISDSTLATDENPRGYKFPLLRPDINGWQPWVNTWQATVAATGYQRMMVWTASGVYRHRTNLNFPFNMLTPLASIPAARDSMQEFRRLSGTNRELGFWWGNSVTVMQGWDTDASVHGLDVRNSADRAAGFAELDAARAAGAKLIGLDAYGMQNPGDGYRWLQDMKAHAPEVRFVTENAASDLIHNLAPTFHENSGIFTPHVVADFLNPGQETWANMTVLHEPTGPSGPTTDQLAREARRIAALGFVPLSYFPLAVTPDMTAVESWRTSIPAELRPAATASPSPPRPGTTTPTPVPSVNRAVMTSPPRPREARRR
jgi:hypothetical protein